MSGFNWRASKSRANREHRLLWGSDRSQAAGRKFEAAVALAYVRRKKQRTSWHNDRLPVNAVDASARNERRLRRVR
jgi:hypothetical protein